MVKTSTTALKIDRVLKRSNVDVCEVYFLIAVIWNMTSCSFVYLVN